MKNLPNDFDNIELTTQFGGYFSSYDKTKIVPNVLVGGSKNVYKKINGNIGVRDGLKRRGTADSTYSAVSSEYVYRTSWGDQYLMWVSNGKLQVEIETATNTFTWYTLMNTTATRWVFDIWWDNTLKKNKVIAVNGTDNLYAWAGGVTTIASTTINTITKTGTATWTEDHFESTGGAGTVVINGTSYAYTGGAGTTTLTGVTPDPTGEANGSYVLSGIVTTGSKPAASYPSDFLKVVNNRAFIGSYTSQLVYISSSTDYTNFTIPGSIVPGSPNILTLDGVGKGIAVRQGNAHVSFGTDGWVEVTFPTYTNSTGVLLEQITPVLKPVQALGAALAHEFIGNNGDNFVYLAQDQQLRYFGGANTSFTTVYPALSQEIYTELQAEDFDGGGIKIISDRTYLTAPNTGNVWIYQARQNINAEGIVVAERLWYPPFVLNATRIDEINGEIVAFSNANPQVYYVWETNQWYDDSPSDEPLPYTCIAAFPYVSAGNQRQIVQNFQRLYTEGYLATGSPLYALINYDYLGSTAKVTAPVNTTARPATLYQTTVPSLGDTSNGETPIGDVVTDQNLGYPKFRSINMFSPQNCFEYQKVYFSDEADSRWEILATGTDARTAGVDPVQLVNKM